jgi:hypothetical protein
VGTGRIVVESTPPRAGVTINDKWAGRTPVTIDSARFGRYTVRVVQPGFEVSREQFTLSASDPSRRLALKLTPVPAAKSSARKSTPAAPKAESPVSLSNGARYTGTVYVDSRPRGARVFVDGKAVGTTPLRLPDVASGSHVIRLELHGHYLWSVSRQVSAGQETRVTGSLEPLQ